jgi:hypothetical protein
LHSFWQDSIALAIGMKPRSRGRPFFLDSPG